MADDKFSTQPTDIGSGPPPRDLYPVSDIRFVITEVTKLQVEHVHVKAAVSETSSDMKDVRDRLARLEERVTHLPSKGFIALVVTTSLVIAGGLLTVAPKLQSWAGTSPAREAPLAPTP